MNEVRNPSNSKNQLRYLSRIKCSASTLINLCLYTHIKKHNISELTIMALTMSFWLFLSALMAFPRLTFACDITRSTSFSSTPVSSTSSSSDSSWIGATTYSKKLNDTPFPNLCKVLILFTWQGKHTRIKGLADPSSEADSSSALIIYGTHRSTAVSTGPHTVPE
jgi:hypothetical protein